MMVALKLIQRRRTRSAGRILWLTARTRANRQYVAIDRVLERAVQEVA
jgi:hypothetical protein